MNHLLQAMLLGCWRRCHKGHRGRSSTISLRHGLKFRTFWTHFRGCGLSTDIADTLTDMTDRITDITDRITDITDRITDITDRITDITDRITDITDKIDGSQKCP